VPHLPILDPHLPRAHGALVKVAVVLRPWLTFPGDPDGHVAILTELPGAMVALPGEPPEQAQGECPWSWCVWKQETLVGERAWGLGLKE
jgi:hypothetical protein